MDRGDRAVSGGAASWIALAALSYGPAHADRPLPGVSIPFKMQWGGIDGAVAKPHSARAQVIVSDYGCSGSNNSRLMR